MRLPLYTTYNISLKEIRKYYGIVSSLKRFIKTKFASCGHGGIRDGGRA